MEYAVVESSAAGTINVNEALIGQEKQEWREEIRQESIPLTENRIQIGEVLGCKQMLRKVGNNFG